MHFAYFDVTCNALLKSAMAVDRNKLDDLLKQLPEELKDEVFHFAESLIRRKDANSSGNGAPPVRSFFGIWDSGDSHSADNDRIDADLAREYASSPEVE